MSCPDCFRGSIHEGNPRGKEIELHGLPTYVVEPVNRDVKGIIIFITDAFGWKFGNSRLLCDSYADNSAYRVYMPDFMDGHAASLAMFDSMAALSDPKTSLFSKPYYIFTAATIVIPWLYYNRPGASFPRVLSFFKTLRANEGASLPVGAAGFCWGGKHVCLLGHGATDDNGKPLMDAGFTAHPSMLSLPSDVEKLVRPVSFALAETDNQVSPAQGAQIEKIVGGKEGEAKGESIIYKGTGHGFSIRADLTHSDVAEQAKKAENQCISWFNKHFNIAE